MKRLILATVLLIALVFSGCSSSEAPKSTAKDQDREFIQWYKKHSRLVIDDFRQIRIALERGDIDNAASWAKQMKSDTETPRCDEFKVSTKLVPAQTHYKSFLASMNQAAAGLLDFFENGNSKSFDTALEHLETAFNQLNMTESYIQKYCESHEC